ncbi:hypothetical protein [Streptomyces sp. NPDC050504]|uniref:hypothetical protein n=1 Tax=Streptomyces sp. NPDC050504 TaxID=3365618 RepID=UPI0037A3390D
MTNRPGPASHEQAPPFPGHEDALPEGPAPAREAVRRATGLTDPVLTVRRVSRLELLGRRYLGREDCALVLSSPEGSYETYLPPRRPLGLHARATAYEVDLGSHPWRLDLALPSENASFEFEASLDLSWQVVDAERCVVSQVRDVPALLGQTVLRLLRPVTRAFAISECAGAEARVQEVVDGSADLLAGRGLRWEGAVSLRPDAGVRTHQERLRTAGHDAVAAGPEHEVAVLRAAQEQAIKEQKIAFYHHYLAEGGLGALLVHLSEHSEDTKLVVESLRQDQIRKVDYQLRLMDQVLAGGGLEKYQLEEPKKLVLELFRKMLAQAPAAPPAPDKSLERAAAS